MCGGLIKRILTHSTHSRSWFQSKHWAACSLIPLNGRKLDSGSNVGFSRKEQSMKQQCYGISFLVTALAALALSGPARAGVQVPFQGRSSGVVTAVGFDPGAGECLSPVQEGGDATPLRP